MADSDNTLLALPAYICPECNGTLYVGWEKLIEKRSKFLQRKDDKEEGPRERDDIQILPTSCQNPRCSQYYVVKLVRIPRVTAPGVRISEGG